MVPEGLWNEVFFDISGRCIPVWHQATQHGEETVTTTILEAPVEQQTEHPHIIRVEGVCGGRPIIRGTRISVRHIAQLYKAGDTVEEILQAHPHLSPAAVYDAISYYLDHQQEIEGEIVQNRLESLKVKYDLEVDERGFLRFAGKAQAQ